MSNYITPLFKKGYKCELSEGSIVTPVFRSSTFCFKNSEVGKRAFEIAYGLDEKKDNEDISLIYSRVNNPNMEILENKLSLIEDSEESLIFSSGMSAISSTFLSFLKPGDSIIFSTPTYGGTDCFFSYFLKNYDININKFNNTDYDDLEKKLKENNFKIIYVETPSNPLLTLTSIKKIVNLRDLYNKDALVVVDNTVCGPIFLKPLELGADISLYSVTKFIAGHSDVVAGSVSGKKHLLDKIKTTRTLLGCIADPDTCWLIQRSLPTLDLRMKKQMETTKYIVSKLQNNHFIDNIYYPGLNNDIDILKDEYKGSGSLFSFTINTNSENIFKFLNKVKIFQLAVSLGSVESLIQHPFSMTHSGLDNKTKLEYGITDKLIRCSVGLEDRDDLLNDIIESLNSVIS